MSYIGEFFRARRIQRAISTSQLARQAGYQNLNKGRKRIETFEGGGKVAPDLLGKLATALEISPGEVRRLAAEDYQDWLDRANEPIRPHLVLRWMSCVYQRIELPDDTLEPGAAQEYAAHLARDRKLMVCLVLSRWLSIGYDSAGNEYKRLEATPEVPCEPYVVIGGKRVQFDFSGGEVLHPIDEQGR